MVPVESSNVAAIGYVKEYRLLRVQFRDGSIYDYPSIGPEQHEHVMGAPSKGKAIADLRRHGTKLTDASAVELREPARPVPPYLRTVKEGEMPAPLQMIDADDCCSQRFAKEARTGSLDKAEVWTCPRCSVEYRPQMVDGTVRHWVANVYVSLVRPRL